MNNTEAIKNNNDSIAENLLALLFDNGEYTQIDRFVKNNGAECEVATAYGDVNGMLVYAYAQKIDVNNGAMGRVQASKIAHVYELATKTGAPVVAIFNSNGAHVDEGVEALEAYGALIKAAGNISGVVPQIAVVSGACIGSAAVLANLSDFVIMTKDAELYITAPTVSANSDYAKVAAENGTATVVAPDDAAAMKMAAELLTYLPANNLSEPVYTDCVAPSGEGSIASIVDADSFFELYADYGKCVKTGFARIAGAAVGIVATVSSVNDGYFCDCGARKAA